MVFTLQELQHYIYSKVYEVYDIFKDFFGEAFVDLQGVASESYLKDLYHTNTADGVLYSFDEPPRLNIPDPPFILVWWPTVTVTNEYDKSVDIDDLFAKIPITLKGCLPSHTVGFKLNRSTYSMLQYRSNYLHSHIYEIPKNPSEFLKPCLGRGPINNTINSLYMDFDRDLWLLFCQELSMYVTVESISGVPYRRLENIGDKRNAEQRVTFEAANRKLTERTDPLKINDLKNFIYYYLKNGNLKFSFQDGCYSLGMSHYDFLVDISNSFIDYFNQFLSSKYDKKVLISECILTKRIANNGIIYSEYRDGSPGPFMGNIGKHVCYFKGKDITLKVYDDKKEDTPNFALILSPAVASSALQHILTILNFRIKKHDKDNRNFPIKEQSGGSSSSSPCQAVCYI